MKQFLDEEANKDALNLLLHRHKQFILQNMVEVDPEVADQKTRFQKFWCWLIFGHLNKKGKCMRCGKVTNQNKS